MDQAKDAIENALKLRSDNEHIVCAFMGGDGSISRNVNYLTENSITIKENINLIAFAFLPYGTGNDCARSLGWGPRDTGTSWGQDIKSVAQACCS